MARDGADAVVALKRFGLGPRPGEWSAISGDPRGFVASSIGTPPLLTGDPLPAGPEALVGWRRYRADLVDGKLPPLEATRRHLPPSLQPDDKRQYAQILQREEFFRRFAHAVATDRPFAERWAMFWSNHLCVVSGKVPSVSIVAGAYEREAIRPAVFGRFTDLLIAAVSHPAMLFSLDNVASVGPNSKFGKQKRAGFNENLAREILELHTLGVDGGYTQGDVTAFAKVLTGWTVGPGTDLPGAGGFVFSRQIHEPGPQTVLGTVYDQDGPEQALAVLRDVAARPETARHLARKIVRHFVGDGAPAAIAAAVEARWRETGGDLAEVARTLVAHPAAWAAPAAKVLPPYDQYVAFARALVDIPPPERIRNWCRLLGQPVWEPPGPNGFSDGDDDWASPDAVATRLDIATIFAAKPPDRPAGDLHDDLFGPAARPETRQTLDRAESRTQALALLLMAPEFQRR